MTKKNNLGQLGENFACQYLLKGGYKIIERNFRRKWGELDIVAKAPDKTLVFIEVKTIQKHTIQDIEPENQLTRTKLQKLKRTASLYVGNHRELIKDNRGWQIDLIALVFRRIAGSDQNKPNNLTINEKNCDIRHYENIA